MLSNHGEQQQYAEIGFPKAYRVKDFSKYHASTPAQAAAKEAAADFPYSYCLGEAESAAQGFDPEYLNLVLAGPTGTGKTHLACAVLRNEYDCVGNAAFISTVELVRKFRDKPTGEAHLMRHYGDGVDALCLDDLGVDADAFAVRVIGEILDRRVSNDLKTIVTTNATKSELRALLGERGFSRLMCRCKWVPVVGDDYRLKP